MNNAGDWLLNLSIGRLGDFISINVLKKRRFRFGLSLNTSQLLPFLKASFSIAWTECKFPLFGSWTGNELPGVLAWSRTKTCYMGIVAASNAFSYTKRAAVTTDWQTTYSFLGTSNSTIYVTVLYQRLESSCIKRAFLRYWIWIPYWLWDYY